MMTIMMKWTAVTPIKRVLHCLMDHPCWKEISRRKLWFPRSLVSHRGVLFIANLVQEKETTKPYKAWQTAFLSTTGSYRNRRKRKFMSLILPLLTYTYLYANVFCDVFSKVLNPLNSNRQIHVLDMIFENELIGRFLSKRWFHIPCSSLKDNGRQFDFCEAPVA